MRTVCSIAIFLSCATVCLADPFQNLGLLPIERNPAAETEDVPMGERLAMVDSLEEQIYDLGAADDSLRSILASYYAGSSLMKHRVWALEVHSEFDEPNAPQALLAKSQIYDRTFNPWSAKHSIDNAVDEAPDKAITHRFLGTHWMERGRHALNAGMLLRAQAAYEEAVLQADAGYDDWLGLASVLLARGDRTELARVSAKLVELRPDAVAPLLYDAVANDALGMSRSAELRFREAMTRLSPEISRRFSNFEDFVRQLQIENLIAADQRLPAPPGLIEFWTRLVECEVIFGQPVAAIHGWDHYAGQMYLLLGRPKEHAYYPAMGIPSTSAILALNRWHRFSAELPILMRGIDGYAGVWIWIVDIGSREIPFVFQKGAQFASWAPSEYTERKWGKLFENAAPLNLHRRPFVRRLEATLRARHASFASSFGDGRVECSYSVAVPKELDEDELSLRWELFRVEGTNQTRVDRLETAVSDQPRRADLLDGYDEEALGAKSRLGQFSAVLDEGSYLARLELLDADGATLKGQDERFELGAPPDRFAMSDLVLADSFAPLSEMPGTPAVFVRHGQAIVPHPEYQALPELDRLHVYYEVYGARLDQDGNTNLDVLYEVFPSESYDPYEAGRFDRVPEQAPVVRLLLSDDRTGSTAAGTTVRGTSLRLDELTPGRYVLVVSVSDRLARQEARKILRFAR